MTEPARILVIDDEIDICEGIKRVLSSRGHQVEIALDGDEGLQKFKDDPFDLVLIDVMMPGIGGIDLIGMIHEQDPEAICIIITGYATVELAVQSIKTGAYDFLTKPFSIDDLNLTVDHGLERRRLAMEARRVQEAEAQARRLAQEKAQLEALDLAKRQFIRLVTHELQAPVAAIENYLQLILKDYIPPEEQTEILEKCLTRAREELALIADLLELGHLEVIKSYKNIPVKMDQILGEVIAGLQEQAKQKKLKIQVEVAENIPPILGAPEQVKSLWTNLISNAIKYTPEGGDIKIQLRSDRQDIIGEVRDTGIGIPPEDQERLFTEFYRAKNAREMGIKGTGLGLTIVKRIVDGMGGNIKLESELGQGASFIFNIPLNMGQNSR